MAAIKLYSFPQVIELIQTDRGVRNNSLSLKDSDFKVYKGSANPIEFIIRDNDRRPVSLAGRTVTMTVLNFFTGEAVFQKEADIIDEAKGKIRVTFVINDTAQWEPCFFKYSMNVDYCDGATIQMLYTDQNHNACGFFEFIDGCLPQPTVSYRALGTAFTPTNNSPPTTEPTIWVSSGFPGDASFGEDDGLHTAVVYVNNFAGKFWIQGSLEESPDFEEKDWFDIFLTSFNPYFEFGNTPGPDDTFTGLEPFNFTGSIRWVRFKYVADSDNTGQIIQVLYRN